ncbi:facilitated trehalose transporter Tret1-2 homolog [Diabrotica virgifera virgifera]|uniref:Major facilitator superfamily (MFS) profile domain-containing protein n=1 Tax=Diabrotica virgifera virgifera TaxID=50390 RepID=A0ABM5IS28_DIAVI|nr:facilitated trehalose transporter Tret1-2 homolog [Diabrotica virgifera virgifera]
MTIAEPSERHGVEYVPYNTQNTEKNNLVQLKPQNQGAKSDTPFLMMTILSGTMLATITGSNMVWTSPVIPKITSNISDDNPLGRTATTYEISMIAGFPPLASLAGSLFLGQLAEVFGRKRSILILALGNITSVVCLAFSTNVYCIVVFRCIIFMFFNGAITVLPVYLTEICEDHNRARYGCLMGGMLPLGSLFGYVVGSFFTIRVFTLLTLSPLLLFIFFCVCAPESPVYSLSRGRREECLSALRKLRSNKNDKEIENDVLQIEEALKLRASSSSGNIFSLFSTKERRYATLLAFIPPMIQVLSGVAVLVQFMAPIFIAAGTKYNSNHLAIVAGAIKVISFIIVSFIVEKTGRRSMLLISTIGSSIPLLMLGGFFFLKHINSPLVASLQWLPLTSIVAFMVTYSLGIGPIPMAIMGELFTSDVRAAGVSFIMTVMGTCLFCATTSFPIINEFLGLHWCIWMYSVFCLAGATFIYFMIPETKGKTVVEIQEYIKSCVNK